MVEDEGDRSAAEKGRALFERVGNAQPQRRARGAVFAQPMLHDGEGRLPRVGGGLRVERARFEQEARLIGREDASRGRDFRDKGAIRALFECAPLAEGPDEARAGGGGLLAGEALHVAARRQRRDSEDRRFLPVRLRQQRHEQPVLAGSGLLALRAEMQRQRAPVGRGQAQKAMFDGDIENGGAGAPARRIDDVDERRVALEARVARRINSQRRTRRGRGRALRAVIAADDETAPAIPEIVELLLPHPPQRPK